MSSRTRVSILAALAAALSLAAASTTEQTWTNVPVVDTQCVAKVKDNPDAHTRKCAIQCAKGGYGLIAEDGAYLVFDEKGNDLVIAALKASEKDDHLRATVTGERSGDRIKVRSFTLN